MNKRDVFEAAVDRVNEVAGGMGPYSKPPEEMSSKELFHEAAVLHRVSRALFQLARAKQGLERCK